MNGSACGCIVPDPGGTNAMIKRLLLALLLLSGLLFEMPNASGWRWLYAVWNFGHVVLFALLTHIALRWRRQRTDLAPAGVSFGLALVAVMAMLGGLIEVGQWLIGRDCEWQDVGADTAGAVLVVLFSQEWRQALATTWQRSISVMLGALLLLWSLQEVALQSVDSVLRQWAFPELYSPAAFTATAARLELLRTTVAPVMDDSISGSPLLRVDLWPGEFSTLTLDQLVSDWRGYDTLIWRWYNPGDSLVLSCRAHDIQHERNGFDHRDRFNQPLVLAPGWNTLQFPLTALRDAPATRDMDLAQMRSIACFTEGLQQPRRLYLEQVYLGRSPSVL